jgi:uncharacterized protein (TIGR03382 family)
MNKTGLLASAITAAALLGCAADQPDLGSTAGDSFEEFKSKLGREPGTGGYILDWDIVIHSEEALYDHWQQYQQGALAIYSINGQDIKWNDTQKLNLTYCIGASFGANKQAVVTAMNAATVNGWEKFANVKFVYVPAQDANCNAQNQNVLFDVNQVNSGGQYLARAFFPNSPRAERNVLIDPASFNPQQTGGIPVANIVIHELGHTLGFRHEHIRTDQGRAVQCPEGNEYRGVTDYDVVSTMHYPQCGSPNNTLALSQKDQQGAALVYGAPVVNVAPMADVTRPSNGATVPPTFDVEASIVDTNLAQVELYIDGAPHGTPLQAGPYIFEVMNLDAGEHLLEVKATDVDGLATSETLNITVSASGGDGGGGGGGGGGGNGTGGGDGPSTDITGGCSTSGSGASLLLGLGLLGLVIRRRR